MWREMDEDCLFVEMSRNLTAGPHHVIECIPVPVEVGDTAPIYFKVRLLTASLRFWARFSRCLNSHGGYRPNRSRAVQG